LIIGIVAGVVGLLAIIGFLVFYIMRQKRLMAERLAEEEVDEDEEDDDAVQNFKSVKRGPASKKRNLRRQQESEEEEEDELDEDIEDEPKKKPIPKNKLQKINNAPVHPYQDNGDEDEDEDGVNPF
jgi:FtsZ-interacting cell division protein ZipA